MSCYVCLAPSVGNACPLHQTQHEIELRMRKAKEHRERAKRLKDFPILAAWESAQVMKLEHE